MKSEMSIVDMVCGAVKWACRAVSRVLHAIDRVEKALEEVLTDALNNEAETLAAAAGWNSYMEDAIMQEVMKQVHDEIGSLPFRLQ